MGEKGRSMPPFHTHGSWALAADRAALSRGAGTSPEERAAFLAETCAGDEALRREVEALLDTRRNARRMTATPYRATVATLS